MCAGFGKIRGVVRLFRRRAFGRICRCLFGLGIFRGWSAGNVGGGFGALGGGRGVVFGLGVVGLFFLFVLRAGLLLLLVR